MSEGSSNQPRFCTNCGTQVRSGTQFCVNCGASLLPHQETTESSLIPSSPSVSEQVASAADSVREGFQRARDGFPRVSQSPVGNTWRGTPGRFFSWFRDLSGILKIIIAGVIIYVLLILLVLLALLSPVMRVVVIIVFGVSVLALIIRGVQRRSVMKWGVAAVTSLALIPVFGIASNVFYGNPSETSINETAVGQQYSDDGEDNEGISTEPAGEYDVFNTYEEGLFIACPPPAEIITVWVEAEADSRDDLYAIADSALADYSDTGYDIVSVGIVLAGSDDPSDEPLKADATVANTEYGLLACNAPYPEFSIQYYDEFAQ